MPQPFKFVGQYGVMTEPNGFYYMRARYYDPKVGRFISEDPIVFNGGDVNLYGYVGNQPVSRFDPFGLTWLVFERSTGTLFVHPGTTETYGPPRASQAGNNPASGSQSWANGTYAYGHYKEHAESNKNGTYGSWGNFVFNVPGHSGMGGHSGRADSGGPSHVTGGCIRTTDEATEAIYKYHFGGDPLNHITVTDYISPIGPSNRNNIGGK